MKRLRNWTLSGVLFISLSANAQVSDSVSLSLESEFSSADSLSIFSLIDSLLQLSESLNNSQLAVRLAYNSNVLSAGRTLGIENFGLAPGISYFHKSGAFADVTAYYSKDFEPNYYLTVASLGYMKDISKHFSIMSSYDRYFYHLNDSYIPYDNTFSLTPIFDWQPFSISATYSLYFGDQIAHRFLPTASFTFARQEVWKIDRISVSPAAYMLLGNEIITTLEYQSPSTIRQALQNLRMYGTRYSPVLRDKNIFGVMNYAFTIPIRISIKEWSLSVAYTYNIPKALPGEPFALDNSTFISASLMYAVDLKGKKPL